MKPLNFIAIVIATAIASHTLALHFIPSGIMNIAMKRIPVSGVISAEKMLRLEKDPNRISSRIISQKGINVAMPSARMDHRQRTVVRSTPDILYTACIYDLNDGPLQLTTPTIGGYTSVSAFADNEIGRLIEDFILQGGVDTSLIKWVPYDGLGREVRNGLNFTERGFGIRGAVGVPDRGLTATSQLRVGDIDWDDI